MSTRLSTNTHGSQRTRQFVRPAALLLFFSLAASNLRAGEPPAHSPKPYASTTSHRGRATAASSGIQSAGSQSVLAYATYLGNPGYRINSLALGSDGTIYVAGVTLTSAAGLDPTEPSSGAGTAFVARLSSDGSQLLYFANLGTGAADEARAVAVDLSGNAYVTGQTHSDTFPVANALQSACTQNSSGQCSGDAFVAKVNPQGAIVYATYLGGSGQDAGNAISLDASGNIYIAGATTSTDFPTFKPAQSSLGGGQDAFVAKISADGSRVLFATYLGGKGDDEARGIALDAAGNIFVAGATSSLDFPTQSALESACLLNAKSACAGEAFVTKSRRTAPRLSTPRISAAAAATLRMQSRSTRRAALMSRASQILQIFSSSKRSSRAPVVAATRL